MEKQPQLSVQGTTLAILAPYLPYDIKVRYLLDEKDYQLDALTATGRVVIDYFQDGEGWVDLHQEADYFLPVLGPFSQLCEPLADGTVPAERVLEILEIPLRKGEKLHINDSTLWLSVPGLVKGVWTLGRFMAPEIPSDVAQYLRSVHFAVGLDPSQFIEKGGSPAIQEGGPAGE